MNSRKAEIQRSTLETTLSVVLVLDGKGEARVKSGIPFLDHLLATLARHARFDLDLQCQGDLEVDDHHSAEDCGLTVGSALDQALGSRAGIARFGSAYAPLDEALARAVVDLSGRSFAALDLGLRRERIGTLSAENVGHVISSLVTAARITVHVDVLKGSNDHHRAEAAFKALALALRQAVALTGAVEVPSTKGVL